MKFWHSVLEFESEKIAPWIALPNTVGFALLLAAGIALGHIPEDGILLDEHVEDASADVEEQAANAEQRGT